MPQRTAIFISHANPEDNEFSRWLTAKLRQQGYRVFCDLLNLKGGEDFWREAEKAIRIDAVKFVFVLSRTSNEKTGPLNELRVAVNVARDEELKDFIIPILLDDLPPREANIEISRLNMISAKGNWATALKTLILKLKDDRVTRDSNMGVAELAGTFEDTGKSPARVTAEPENYSSNWFRLSNPPNLLFSHRVAGFGKLGHVARDLPFPAVPRGRDFVTAAGREELAAHLPDTLRLTRTVELRKQSVQSGSFGNSRVEEDDFQRIVVQLLRIGFERACVDRGMDRYRMANRITCLYVPSGLLEGDKVHFRSLTGKRTWRQLVGHRSRKNQDNQVRLRYWHFGLSAKVMLEPIRALAINPHVLFSDEGKSIWRSAKRLHSARRSQCKDWWNNDWRDRLLATIAWLSDGDTFAIPLAHDRIVTMLANPVSFKSPVSFRDP